MKTITSIVFLLTLSLKALYAASLTAQLDINPVLVSDSFHLTYTASGKVDGTPDFSPIKKYFELLGTRQSNNIRMINGDFQQSTNWILTLIAKKTGTFTIPAVSFGADRAPEVKVIVKDVAISNSATPSQDFIVELETSRKTVFTQQQIVITARLLISKNINSYQFGKLTTDNPDTQVVVLTKDRQYKTYKGKKQYIVVEKKFALFPSEPGKLKINPFIAEIVITNRSSRGRFFDPFNTSSITKRIISKPITLNINAVPAIFKGNNWLPGTSVKLGDEWPKNKKFIVGEPITRTITLTAEGLTSTHLTEIKQKQTDGLKQYPDKPVSQENKTESGINLSLEQKIAYIPTYAGSYTLPAITIPWWNVKKNKTEIARLSERKFTVQPSRQNNLNQAPTIKQSATGSINSNPHSTDMKIEGNAENTNQQFNNKSSFWFWLSILFFTFWLLTIFLWWKSKSIKTRHEEKNEQLSQSMSEILKNIKISCENNNAQDTKSALLNWAKPVFPKIQINNLSDLAKQFDHPFSQKIELLNTHLYGATSSSWECNGIYELCKNHKTAHTRKTKKSNSAKLEAFKYE